jgi:glycolate oxidase iron-sulfur subunit
VQYGRLVDIGREVVERKVRRSFPEVMKRVALLSFLLSPLLFGTALRLGRAFRGILPAALAKQIPERRGDESWPVTKRPRRMVVLRGCVQASLAPSINAATARVLDRLGIQLVEVRKARCCGAVSHHLNAHEEALDFARDNIDEWWPHVKAGVEAIVITASGCGTMVADYGHLLRNDPDYAERAARISALAKDVSEVVAAESVALANAFAGRKQRGESLAFHSPCSLQHGLKVKGVVESILRDAGFTLCAVPDGHLCCGSAGTYSILQPELSGQLLRNKVAALESGSPEVIATANIGCLMHIQSGTQRPVRHWIEILDARLGQ